MTNDLFGIRVSIAASGWIGTTILSYRLIVISQAIGDKRIPNLISSGWDPSSKVWHGADTDESRFSISIIQRHAIES